ncbi:MAG TPA: DUF1080 domain-containing protein [Bryobacteraceae bacterium]|nr:DUF1080 domain-containing protein [Bryobacteraceae bacterium]
MIGAAVLLLAAAPIFNGRDLTGWVHEGDRATFSVHDAAIVVSGRGFPPNWLHTVAEYRNFRLSFEYKLAQWAEAAVILRAPRLGRPMQSGIAVFLGHDFHQNITPYITGAIAGVRPPSSRLPTSYGEWHRAEIVLREDRLHVTIDGTVVQDVNLSADRELSLRRYQGFIGFPDLGHGYGVRNIHLEDLGGVDQDSSLLRNGSLTGWHLRGAGTWSVHEGVIIGANGHGILYAPPVLQDFELSGLVRSRNRVNAGLFFRGWPDSRKHRGFEVQVYSPPDAVYPTGSVYGKQRSRIAADLEERWFFLQVRVEGSRCLVRIDGETVAEYDRLSGPDLQPGRIGLQIHSEDAQIEFRDLRVRSLTVR